MLNKLVAQNIKCFELQEFQFSELTVFCGANSAGKSTALQCLLLLRQAYNVDRFKGCEIALIGEYFSAGHVSDLISHSAKTDILSIQLDDLLFATNLQTVSGESYHLPFAPLEKYSHTLFENDFIYLSAERLGPRNSYEVSVDSRELNLGIYGEFAMAEFVRRASSSAPNQELVKITCFEEGETSKAEANEALTLEIAVKTVMRTICPGFDITYESHKTVDRVSSTFASSTTKTTVRPVNSGFGVSYVFPIVVGAFCIRPGGTFIIENPEVHLHPQAQSELAYFLSQLSLSGVQVIIETHSDHIINGIRLFAKNNKTDSRHISINSIGRSSAGREIKLISVDGDGNLSGTQEGFFDQAEKDLLQLF